MLAVGGVFGMLCAPMAVADPGTTACQPGQIVIDGQCNTPPPPNKAPDASAPAAGANDQGGARHG